MRNIGASLWYFSAATESATWAGDFYLSITWRLGTHILSCSDLAYL